ncbi:MAG: hypothetical protein K0S47_1570 [Herbinix sp.]|jgi:TrmH family RNA methyltransferase|nr:hypothetical protein [Herbinix sp.]
MKPMISSISNPRMKNLILLQKKAKEREEQGVFVIEGRKMFEEAKEAGDLLMKTYVSESFYHAKMQEDPMYFEDTDMELVTDAVMKEVSETKTPQGILALVKAQGYTLEQIIKAPYASLLLLEDIRDPGNLGTILRSAEGAGITGVILNNSCVDIYNPKVVRSTMGSIYRVPFYYAKDFEEAIEEMKEMGIRIYAAHLSGKPYDSDGNFTEKCALLIGNEANGLSPQISAKADALIKIPMAGKVESLNAAVAAAILMYEIARQRRNA